MDGGHFGQILCAELVCHFLHVPGSPYRHSLRKSSINILSIVQSITGMLVTYLLGDIPCFLYLDSVTIGGVTSEYYNEGNIYVQLTVLLGI
jgi:hypothetical protein